MIFPIKFFANIKPDCLLLFTNVCFLISNKFIILFISILDVNLYNLI